jgi:hypothetical protein
MKLTSTFALIASLLLPTGLSAKCYVYQSSATLIHESGASSVLYAGWVWNGNIGTIHLGGDDAVVISLDFDCPNTGWIYKDGQPWWWSPEQGNVSMSHSLTEPGSYEVWAGNHISSIMSLTIDHNTSSTAATTLSLNAFLEGAMGTGANMRDDLRAAGLLPLSEPYSGLGHAPTDAAGSTTTAAMLANADPNLAIVDWVLLELRSAAAPGTVVYSKAALLRRNGGIVGTDGQPPVVLVTPGYYHIALRHRNHLGIMSSQARPLFGVSPSTLFGYSVPCWGTDAMVIVNNVRCMRSGNVNFGPGAQSVKYTGASNDRDPILMRVGSTTPNSTATGYFNDDINLDGVVKYTGSGNDRDPVLTTIASTTPNAVRMEQLP